MALVVERFDIDGILLVRSQRFGDPRGYFSETYNARTFAEAGIGSSFLQDNLSQSAAAGTIRGLHFQIPPAQQNKLIRVTRGSIFDVAVDLRCGSSTYGRWCGMTLTSEDDAHLFVPSGFAHGYCTLEPDTEVVYKVDEFYAPAYEAGLRWDDPDIAISWPVTAADVIVSDKDAKLPAFRTFISPFQV
jgi:dTDP-4-dehydrorhamnose 3,5-epimerase